MKRDDVEIATIRLAKCPCASGVESVVSNECVGAMS
jgi:hypothetical protein